MYISIYGWKCFSGSKLRTFKISKSFVNKNGAFIFPMPSYTPTKADTAGLNYSFTIIFKILLEIYVLIGSATLLQRLAF